MTAEILPFPDRPSPETLIRKIRGLAKDSNNIVWISNNFTKILSLNGLDIRLVLETLRGGEINSKIRRYKNEYWRVTITHFISGRLVTVNVAVAKDHLVVHSAA